MVTNDYIKEWTYKIHLKRCKENRSPIEKAVVLINFMSRLYTRYKSFPELNGHLNNVKNGQYIVILI